jgi:spore protease
MNRTDLASELTADGISHKESDFHGLLLTETKLGSNNPIGKPAGTYTTLHCDSEIRDEKAESDALFQALTNFIPRTGRILVAGLGNANITPDSLGVRAASRVVATAHLSGSEDFTDLGMREIFVVETGVLAQTGMESSRQLSFIADGIKPDMTVVIDSLACAEPQRLGRTIQVTDTGIAPGSGVGNSRQEVSAKTLGGIPVVAIGVPTVLIYKGMENGVTVRVTPFRLNVWLFYFAQSLCGSRAVEVVKRGDCLFKCGVRSLAEVVFTQLFKNFEP